MMSAVFLAIATFALGWLIRALIAESMSKSVVDRLIAAERSERTTAAEAEELRRCLDDVREQRDRVVAENTNLQRLIDVSDSPDPSKPCLRN